jgi:hypothetical protein
MPYETKTEPQTDFREAERLACAQVKALRVVPKPSFQALKVRVKDVSPKGIGLLCEKPVDCGVLLAIQWHFGEPDQWRTVLARVVRVVPQKNGQLLIGCQFEELISDEETHALLAVPEPPPRSLLHPLEFLRRMGFAGARS